MLALEGFAKKEESRVLDDRKGLVLRAVIEDYIETAEPVDRASLLVDSWEFLQPRFAMMVDLRKSATLNNHTLLRASPI